MSFFKWLMSTSKNKIEELTKTYTEREDKFISILTNMVSSANLNELHCDTKSKKYYVVVGEKIFAIDGHSNKVFMLLEPKQNCEKNMQPFLLRDTVIKELIDIVTERKKYHSELLYKKITDCEDEFLETFIEVVE